MAAGELLAELADEAEARLDRAALARPDRWSVWENRHLRPGKPARLRHPVSERLGTDWARVISFAMRETRRARNALVGTWTLIRWENRSVDGQITYPLGEDAQGLILYGDDGYMSVALMRARRQAFGAGDLLGGTAEEKAQAAEEYVSYCGRYEFEGETVIHHVELSLFPNWVGVDQERLVEIDGNRLTLSSRPLLLDGIEQTAHLVWERAL